MLTLLVITAAVLIVGVGTLAVRAAITGPHPEGMVVGALAAYVGGVVAFAVVVAAIIGAVNLYALVMGR